MIKFTSSVGQSYFEKQNKTQNFPNKYCITNEQLFGGFLSHTNIVKLSMPGVH